MSQPLNIARGATWMVLFKALDRGLGFISTLVLARLLVPQDFGLIAMATSLIALLEMLSYFGLDTALLRDQETKPSHFNAVWSLNALVGVAIALAMLALAIPAAHLYREPRVTYVIAVLAAGPLVQGFENVGVVNFRKEMRFDREFRYMLIKRVLAVATTISLAVYLRNYWALVSGMLVGRVSGLALSYILQPFRPHFSLRSARELLHFSKWLMIGNLVGFFRDRSSDFVIGRIAGPSSLGIFSIAVEISNMPGTELLAPINRAVLPAYMKLAKDLPALKREFLSVIGMVGLLTVPAVAGFALCAPFLVLILLGPKWTQAAELVEILAFYSITQVMHGSAYAAFLAVGKPQSFAKLTAIHVAMLVTLLIALTTQFGLQGAAWAYVTASVISLPIDFFFITRFLTLSPVSYIGRLWRPLCAAALMYIGVRILGPAQPGTAVLPYVQAIRSLAACIGLGAPLYFAAILVLWLISGRPQESAESSLLARARALWLRPTMPEPGPPA